MDSTALEIKRAKNMIWAAASDYSFDPCFVGLRHDGSADEYLNLIHGLVHKWLDYAVIDELLSSLSGNELFEGLLWMGLEHAVYEREREFRPVLSELRRRYAAANLEYQRSVSLTERIDLLHNGYFHEILGQPDTLPPAEKALLRDFLFDGAMDAAGIRERTLALLWQYFSYRPKTAKPPKASLRKKHPSRRSPSQTGSGFINITGMERKEAGAGLLQRFKRHTNYLFDLTAPVLEEDTFAYLEGCFGRSILSDREALALEERFCTGSHQGLHLFFTCGDPSQPSGSERTRLEIARYRQMAEAGLQKNLDYDRKNRRLHQNAIVRLQQKLLNALNAAQPVTDDRARLGRVNAGRIWKNIYCNDARIFTRSVDEPAFGLSVDILLDASSSRENRQEQIAAQGYILAEGLSRLNIPVQISSFLSIRDYTVFRIFRSYCETGQNRRIFQYTAGGSNRDGLALRSISHLMEASPAPNQVLILLTDAAPNDDFCAKGTSRLQKRKYEDAFAVQDTANEVRALRAQGICVLGAFLGPECNLRAAQQIFGKDFVRLQTIGQFADSVGSLLITYLSAL